MKSSHAELFKALTASSDEEKADPSLLDDLKKDFAEFLVSFEKLSVYTDNQLLALLDIQFLAINPSKLSLELYDSYRILQLQDVAFDQCVLALEPFKKLNDLLQDETSGKQLIAHCKLNKYLTRIDSRTKYRIGSPTAEDLIIATLLLWPTDTPISDAFQALIDRLTNRDGILAHSVYRSTMLDFSCITLKSATEMFSLTEEFKSSTTLPIVLAMRELEDTIFEGSAEEKTPEYKLDMTKTENAWLTTRKLDFFWNLPQSNPCEVQLSRYFIYLIEALKNNDTHAILLLLLQIGELTLANKLSAPYIQSEEVQKLLKSLTAFTPNLTQFSEIELTITSGAVTSTNSAYFSALKSGIAVFQQITGIEKQKMAECKTSPAILNILITDIIPNSPIRIKINTLLEKIRNHAHAKLNGERLMQTLSIARGFQAIAYNYYKNPQKTPAALAQFKAEAEQLIATLKKCHLDTHRVKWKNGQVGEFFKVAKPTAYTDFLTIAELIKNEMLGMKQYVDFSTLRTNKSSPHLAQR